MKIGALYYEKAVAAHPRTLALRRRLAKLPQIEIDRYGELFNRAAGNFRLQKQRPSLILARKNEGWVLPTPPGYGIGQPANFYFSHLLNCPYDCRYCFLQGMYRSAHYVLFVNYEDFFEAAAEASRSAGEPACFFSGYDCDSLALDALTGFTAAALPFFRHLPNSWLELRTKSTATALAGQDPWPRCVVAFSLSPAATAAAVDHGAPTIERRLAAIQRLAAAGWPIGLRFDPVLDASDVAERYRGLFDQVEKALPPEALHSISLGAYRMPQTFHHRLTKLYPDDPLIAGTAWQRDGAMVGYGRDREANLLDFCRREILQRWPAERFFPAVA